MNSAAMAISIFNYTANWSCQDNRETGDVIKGPTRLCGERCRSAFGDSLRSAPKRSVKCEYRRLSYRLRAVLSAVFTSGSEVLENQ